MYKFIFSFNFLKTNYPFLSELEMLDLLGFAQ